MAVIAAFRTLSPQIQVDNPNVDPDQFITALPTPDLAISTGLGASALKVSQQPITVVGRTITVFYNYSPLDDFYDRIWRIPVSIAFGYVPTRTSREVWFWNAFYRQSVMLDSITETDADGLTLNAEATPATYLPSEYRRYTIDAFPEGPPNIDATYTFVFGSISVALPVTGIRVVPWTYEPNWINPVLERAAWLTDVQENHDGSEQRRQIRGGARVNWEFTYDVDDDRRRTIENELAAFGGRIWSLPVFTDEQRISAPLSAGAAIIPADTDGLDFHAGGLGMLLGPDGRNEAFRIFGVGSQSIELDSPLELAWPANSKLFPARAAWMLDDRGYDRHTREYVRGLARFQTVEEVDADELAETLYRGRPVLTVEPNWRTLPSINLARKLERLDFEVGRAFVYDDAGIVLPEMRVLWSALDRDTAVYLHRFIWSRRGRQKSVWVPTWSNDFRVLEYEDGTGRLDVAFARYFDSGVPGVHKQDIRIQLVDGSVFYRRIATATVETADTVERFTLDSPIGRNLLPADFDRISWLHLMRLDQDAVELAWQTLAVVETVLSFKGPKHGV